MTPDATSHDLLDEQPLLKHLQVRLAQAADGEGRVEIVVEPMHLRRGGILHGGIYAVVLDTVTGYAAQSIAPAGHDFLTLQLHLNMTGSAKPGDHLIATARAVHCGRRTAVVTGDIRRADGRLLATGSATLMFIPQENAPA
jgi:acyl-CoA thioesterase